MVAIDSNVLVFIIVVVEGKFVPFCFYVLIVDEVDFDFMIHHVTAWCCLLR